MIVGELTSDSWGYCEEVIFYEVVKNPILELLGEKQKIIHLGKISHSNPESAYELDSDSRDDWIIRCLNWGIKVYGITHFKENWLGDSDIFYWAQEEGRDNEIIKDPRSHLPYIPVNMALEFLSLRE